VQFIQINPNDRAILGMKTTNMEYELAVFAENFVVELVPTGHSCQSWSWEGRDGTQTQAIKNAIQNVKCECTDGHWSV
jgi:hypothetical protein